MAAKNATPTTDHPGTRFFATRRQSVVARHRAVAREGEHHPRRGRRRGRDAEELRDDADEEQELGPVLAHRLGPDEGNDVAAVGRLDRASVPGIANVTARRSIQPKTTETTTDVHMPVAAMRDACFVSSAVCADASNPVIVYWDISRPSPNTNQNAGLENAVVPSP